MAIKSFEECLSEAAIERGLDPATVLEVVARARKLEAESQKEASLPQDVGTADVSASLSPDILPVTPIIEEVSVGNRGQKVGPHN